VNKMRAMVTLPSWWPRRWRVFRFRREVVDQELAHIGDVGSGVIGHGFSRLRGQERAFRKPMTVAPHQHSCETVVLAAPRRRSATGGASPALDKRGWSRWT
jgi:hypothetical protein